MVDQATKLSSEELSDNPVQSTASQNEESGVSSSHTTSVQPISNAQSQTNGKHSNPPPTSAMISKALAAIAKDPDLPPHRGPMCSLPEALATLTPDGYIDFTRGPNTLPLVKLDLGDAESKSSDDIEKHDEFIHTTQHDKVEECYIICQIMSEKRVAGLRWLKIDRKADFITKNRATPEQVKEWEEYQRAHLNAEEDREAKYYEAPFETPRILHNCFEADGELAGYIRSYAPVWEPAEHVHGDLIRQWGNTEVYKKLAAEHGW